MSVPFLLGTDYLRKIQSVRPENLVTLWPQNEPLGIVSTEIVRQYNGAYTGVTLGQPGIPGTGLTSPLYDGINDFNNIHSAGFANDNALLNPGFETAGGGGADIWANWVENASDGALANEAVIVHEGADSAKMTAGVSFDTRAAETIVVIPGQRRRVRIWTYGDGVNAGMYYVYDNTNAAPIIATATTGITAAAWGMVAAQYTVPAGCVSIDIGLQCPPVNGGVCYFDACEDRRKDGFLGDQGTIIVPAQVANVGVWTDGAARYAVLCRVNGNNFVSMGRTVVNNQIQFQYSAGGVLESRNIALTTLDWFYLGITWSSLNDVVNFYVNGVPEVPLTVLGTWVGDLSNTETLLGARNTAPVSVWSGNISPVPVWSDALSPDEMRYLG